MKKSLSFLLAVMMLLTSFAITAFAQDAEPIVFNLVEADGTVPFDKGRNGDCCFPKGSSTINPELYFWGSATAKAVDGFIQISSTKGNSTLEFDTFPADKAWKNDGKHTFIAMNVKTGAPVEGTAINVYAQGQKFHKSFPVNYTGEWQQIIIDLNDPTGWYNKDSSEYAYSPMKGADGKQVMAGGFRLDMPIATLGGITVDYIGLFASEAQAKAYKGRQTSASSETVTGTVASSGNTGSSSTTESGPQTGGAVDVGQAIIFNFIEDDGTILFAKGRNGDCYFPKGSSTTNPEVYTWGKGTMVAENGYGSFYPAADFGMMELDTFPTDKAWSADKKLTYVGMTIKTSSEAETSITVLAQAARYKKTFKFKATGEWQRVVLDLNDTTGWLMKNESGQYDAINYSPMKNSEGKQVMTGGMRLDFAGNTVVNSYTFDSFGIFATLDAAKNYVLRETAKTVTVSTGAGASASQGTTTAPEEEEPEEPAKPSMKNALTRGEEPVDKSITLVSAVPTSVVTDDAIVYKYSKIGAYQEDGQRYPVLEDEATSYLQTWGSGKFENTSAGVLKFIASASGGTLFESHTKKSPDPAKFKYLVLGYKTNEDFSDKNNTAYLYTSGNKYRFPLIVGIDGKWNYSLYDLSKTEAYTQGSGYSEKADSTNGISYGAFRIDFPKAVGIEYYIDYIGFFTSEETAKSYIAKSEAAAGLDKEEAPEEEKFTYMKGYDDGTFRPGAQMTRAEAATVIARLLADEEEIAKDRNTAFTDVKKGDWYYSYVTYLEELGFLPNYSGEFKPNQNITRGEFIKLTFEAGGLDFSMKRPKFTDLDKNHPYYKEIVFASGTGIVTGYNNGDGTMSFKPDGEITRAEIATVVNRILKIEATPDAAQEFSDLDKTHWAYGTVMAIASKK
ncbi:MAG: S-layer homology domain-containing protein [Ruminococcaceae bacterium]|nr:S-layer homology domain-containing protein [Oscillospiraceae bacterium]